MPAAATIRDAIETITLVLDFDSTIVSAEGLDEIARLALADDPDRDAKVLAIEGITRDGMEGRIGIGESL
jgi:D-3-phosphoglycerate dehydrogenase / 2-oxoglutarate reductase